MQASIPSLSNVPLLQLPNLASKNVTLRSKICLLLCARLPTAFTLIKYSISTNGVPIHAMAMDQLSWLRVLRVYLGCLKSLRVYLPLQLTLESDDDDDADADENPPDFTCTLRNNKYHLHTHAPADHLIYHLGRNALLGDNQLRKSLAPLAASHWKAVQCTKAVIKQHLHTRPQNTYSRRKNIRDSAEGIAYPFITSTPTSLSLLNIL